MNRPKLLIALLVLFSSAIGEANSGDDRRTYTGPSNAPVVYSIIDSTTNIYNYNSNDINPYAYDPGLNILSLVHTGDVFSYAMRGTQLYVSTSTDEGLTWQRTQLSEGAQGYIPSGSIFNPTNTIENLQIFTAYRYFFDTPQSDSLGLGVSSGPNNYYYGGPSSQTSYESETQTWASKSSMMFSSVHREGPFGSGKYLNIAIFRTGSFGLWKPEPNLVQSTDTLHCRNAFGSLGGDCIDVGMQEICAFGFFGNFYRKYHINVDSAELTGVAIGIIYSTDDGASWGELDTINLASLSPNLGPYSYLAWEDGSRLCGGDLLLDSLGYPHCVVALQTAWNGKTVPSKAVAEIYKTATGWRGKLIGLLNPWTVLGSDIHMYYHPTLARNEEGTVFATQFTNSDISSGYLDLFASGRTLNSSSWSPVRNLTQTPTRTESFAHLAPRLRHISLSGPAYAMYSTYAYWWDTTKFPSQVWSPCHPCRAYLYAGTIPLFLDGLPTQFQPIWVCPTNGYTITTDSTLCCMQVKIQYSGEAPLDSIPVTFRILNPSGTELKASSWKIPYLLPGETRYINWDNCFTPPDTGSYRFQFRYTIPGDTYPEDDTINIFVKVVFPSPITKAASRKLRLLPWFEEIVPDVWYDPAQGDDDRQESVKLPFKMMYNGERFDSVQFSTNGWVQLGKNGYPRDSKFGLSTPGPTGFNENGKGFRTGAPGNSFSPWWEDLRVASTGAPYAGLGIATIGTEPHRVFVIQWKQMLGYYDESVTDVRLNFQARLYESSSIIEFHYGPMTGTVFGGSDAGAMISLKDETGGDYHFLDVYQNISGQVSNGNTLLNPLLHWPGPDSIYEVYPSYVEVTTNVTSGWNLISNPLIRTDMSVGSMFPLVFPGAFSYNNGYIESSTLVPGHGYFIKSMAASNATFGGHASLATVIQVRPGWNLIGSHWKPVTITSDSCLSLPIFRMNNGYRPTWVIEPGKGYWVKAKCPILILSESNPKLEGDLYRKLMTLTISDKDGSSQELYLTRRESDHTSSLLPEMPPIPPRGMFDARFVGSTIIEYFDEARSDEEFRVQIRSISYPITVRLESENTWYHLSVTEVVTGIRHALGAGGVITIEDPAVGELAVNVIHAVETPDEYRLERNYPNPFNPSTMIKFQIPISNFVEIRVFDLLGRRVRELVAEVREAGYYSVTWDGRNNSGLDVPSGIYFVRMTAGSFSKIQRAVLIR